MGSGIYHDNFSEVFKWLLDKTGVSCYQICFFTHLDQGYLSRLKNGSKTNPSAETVIKIALAICCYSKAVKLSEIEALFRSVGRSLNFVSAKF
ncbi:hypothetical protein DGWBC_0911 [Dehalogenimonas sp. WBC-2]|nr:hypothetical protein DGWBC_0911 [Dehalogenimonas sp. WBC-2]